MRKSFPAYVQQLPHKSPNGNSPYQSKIKLDFEKLKNVKVQHAKLDLAKINIKTSAAQLDLLSNDITLFLILPSSNKHYALNCRTFNLLRKGNTY